MHNSRTLTNWPREYVKLFTERLNWWNLLTPPLLKYTYCDFLVMAEIKNEMNTTRQMLFSIILKHTNVSVSQFRIVVQRDCYSFLSYSIASTRTLRKLYLPACKNLGHEYIHALRKKARKFENWEKKRKKKSLGLSSRFTQVVWLAITIWALGSCLILVTLPILN